MRHDYLVVGSGIFGAVFARQMMDAGRKVLVIDKADLAGNARSECIDGVEVHLHGPHIFHTNSQKIWQYVQRFAAFNHYRHQPKAFYRGKIYTLPFCLATCYELWGCLTPAEAQAELERQRVPVSNPRNLEEWALSQIGRDMYEKLVYGYTKKQWGREPSELPASIIRRLPVRMTFRSDYFDDRFQGIPIDGYTKLVEKIMEGIEFRPGEDFYDLADWRSIAKKLVFTGPIDEFYDFRFGELEYRSLRFETKVVDGDHQGIAIMNYTDFDVPYTRICDHKHFLLKESLSKSVITYEYPMSWERGKPRYYPIGDQRNNDLYQKYAALKEGDVIFGGRLGSYRYFDMDQTIGQALTIAENELK